MEADRVTKCPKCQQTVDSIDAYCKFCGARLGIAAPTPKEKKKQDALLRDVAKYFKVPIDVGGGDDDTCLCLAQEGRGKKCKIKHFEEIPGAILEILK